MLIGIDGSRAFLQQRTGIEEYSYQVIKHLRDKLQNHEVVLYVRSNQLVDFNLPENWKVKKLWLPYCSSQLRFSLEFLLNPVEALLVMAHTAPPIHPSNTTVVIHGLEYEFVPKAFSWWGRFYMRVVIKNACRWARKIVAVSANTKKDLMRLYNVPAEKITVVYEGYDNEKSKAESLKSESNLKDKILNSKYLLFIGRLEERKNIIGIIKAFEILKERYEIPHKLVLAGRFGYGSEDIQTELEKTNSIKDIVLPGFVSEQEKWEFFRGADVFLFPTFYEGFGIPILEAQSVGTPVVASRNSSIPEVAGDSVLFAGAMNAEEIADATYELISNKLTRDDIIKKGHENIKRFSWERCAEQLAEVLINEK